MSHAPFIDGTIDVGKHYDGRTSRICKFTPHHMAGCLSAEDCGKFFRDTDRQASSNYGIGNRGELYCYVEDENGAWTSGSYWNDNQAITVEVANTPEGVWNETWEISAAAWETLVKLAVYVCQTYGFRLEYTGDPYGSLTEHRMYQQTGCPGPYIHARISLLEETVNMILDGGGDMLTSEDVWAYTNKALEKVDAYQILRDCRDNSAKAVQIAQQALNAAKAAQAAAEKVATAGVDYDKLSDVTLNKAAKRLQA